MKAFHRSLLLFPCLALMLLVQLPGKTQGRALVFQIIPLGLDGS